MEADERVVAVKDAFKWIVGLTLNTSLEPVSCAVMALMCLVTSRVVVEW